MPRTYECITWSYGKSKYHQEEHLDCIMCSDQTGFKLTLVPARLTKPTSPSFASQAPAPIFWGAPSIEPLPSCAGVQLHTLSSGHLLKTPLYRIHKAHLGLCLLLPLQTLPTTYQSFCSFRLSGTAEYPFSSVNSLPSWSNRGTTKQVAFPCYHIIAFKIYIWLKDYSKNKY